MKWSYGKCGGTYAKCVLFSSKVFDLEVLRCNDGEGINAHIDFGPVKKYKMQVNLKKAKKGGEFYCSKYILNTRWIKIYRADKYEHSVSLVIEGKRIDLIFGFNLT